MRGFLLMLGTRLALYETVQSESWNRNWDGYLKILLDTLLSLLFLILLTPVLLVVSVLIAVFDGTPVFFLQQRLGLNRNKFSLVKFRTMKSEKISRIGGWLRATGIDEIPQLVNVLRQEMSLIGPRPLTEEDVNRLGWDGRDRDVRWTVRPGITGMAQLSPVCDAELTWSQDRTYIETQSVLLDVKIALMTVSTAILGKKPEKSPEIWNDGL